jgi:hypothetical protein
MVARIIIHERRITTEKQNERPKLMRMFKYPTYRPTQRKRRRYTTPNTVFEKQ